MQIRELFLAAIPFREPCSEHEVAGRKAGRQAWPLRRGSEGGQVQQRSLSVISQAIASLAFISIVSGEKRNVRPQTGGEGSAAVAKSSGSSGSQ